VNQSSSLAETQAFFAARALGWEDRYPDDTPQFQRVLGELAVRSGMSVLDVGCGTGRALLLLREAVGAEGRVVGVDATPEMLLEARRLGRQSSGCLVLGDAERLPIREGCFDVVLASGLVPHLLDPVAGLAELARVTRPDGRLAIFHPIGRAALAARHGGAPSDDDITSPVRLGRVVEMAGWRLESIDDAEDRYLALAVRR
jgi:SAM-dependent methyltransferase